MRKFLKIKTWLIYNLIGILLLASCATKKLDTSHDDKMTIITDSKYTKFMIGQKFKLWSPNKEDINKVTSILAESVNDENFYFLEKKEISEIRKYYRQYLCYINENGEKIVFINSMCDLSDYYDEYNNVKKHDWKKEMIKMADGGSCYWNLKINLTTNEYFQLRVNMQG